MFKDNIVAQLKEKISQNPTDVENYNNLANYYIGSSDYNNALLIYKKIVELTPNNYQALANMGSIYFFKKLYLEALDCYNKAKELGLYMQKYCGCVFSEEERYLKAKKIIP